MRVAGDAAEHLVHHFDHGRRIAPRLVLPHLHRAPLLAQPDLCGVEQAHIGAAKAVDRLLRVAHQQHAGPRAIAAIGVEPAAQRGPLQRVGVLKFIEQEMLDARIEPLVQISGVAAVGQQLRSLPLDVVEVDYAARRLEALIGGDESIAQQKRIVVECADA